MKHFKALVEGVLIIMGLLVLGGAGCLLIEFICWLPAPFQGLAVLVLLLIIAYVIGRFLE
jgi:hypothetical protein